MEINKEYVEATENWIKQSEYRLEQSILNKKYLENKIALEHQELKLIDDEINFNSEWIYKTKQDLESYKNQS